jgi:hypothetical protein
MFMLLIWMFILGIISYQLHILTFKNYWGLWVSTVTMVDHFAILCEIDCKLLNETLRFNLIFFTFCQFILQIMNNLVVGWNNISGLAIIVTCIRLGYGFVHFFYNFRDRLESKSFSLRFFGYLLLKMKKDWFDVMINHGNNQPLDSAVVISSDFIEVIQTDQDSKDNDPDGNTRTSPRRSSILSSNSSFKAVAQQDSVEAIAVSQRTVVLARPYRDPIVNL